MDVYHLDQRGNPNRRHIFRKDCISINFRLIIIYLSLHIIDWFCYIPRIPINHHLICVLSVSPILFEVSYIMQVYQSWPHASLNYYSMRHCLPDYGAVRTAVRFAASQSPRDSPKLHPFCISLPMLPRCPEHLKSRAAFESRTQTSSFELCLMPLRCGERPWHSNQYGKHLLHADKGIILRIGQKWNVPELT